MSIISFIFLRMMLFAAKLILIGAFIMKLNMSGTIEIQFGTKLNGYGIDGTPMTPAIYQNKPIMTFNIQNMTFINTNGSVAQSAYIDMTKSFNIPIISFGVVGSYSPGFGGLLGLVFEDDNDVNADSKDDISESPGTVGTGNELNADTTGFRRAST